MEIETVDVKWTNINQVYKIVFAPDEENIHLLGKELQIPEDQVYIHYNDDNNRTVPIEKNRLYSLTKPQARALWAELMEAGWRELKYEY